MRIFLSVLCALGISCLYSCQRDTSIGPEGRPGTDSTYIKEVIYLDTTISASLDTSLIYSFKYDHQKRVIAAYLEEFFVTLPGPELWEDVEYFYNGAETSPYKIVVRSGNYKTGHIREPQTIFLTYSNGMVSRDSVVQGSPGPNYVNLSYTYTKFSSTRYKTQIKGTANFSFPDSVYSQITRVNGNITYQKDSVYSNGNYEIDETRISYDSQRNPFYRIALPYPKLGSFLTEKFPNNQIRYTYDGQTGTDFDEAYEYQYRQDGLPISVRHGKVKGLFIYTSL